MKKQYIVSSSRIKNEILDKLQQEANLLKGRDFGDSKTSAILAKSRSAKFWIDNSKVNLINLNL